MDLPEPGDNALKVDLPSDTWAQVDAFLNDESVFELSTVSQAAHMAVETFHERHPTIGYAHGPNELAALATNPAIEIIVVPGGLISRNYPGKTIVAYGPVAVSGGTVHVRHPQATITTITRGWVHATGMVHVTDVRGGEVRAKGHTHVSGVFGGSVFAHEYSQVTDINGGAVWANDSVQVFDLHAGRITASAILARNPGVLIPGGMASIARFNLGVFGW